MALYWGFRVAAFLARAAPLRAAYAAGRLGGLCAWALWRGGRRRCVRNMLRVAGGDEARARRLARRSFAAYGLYLADFLRFGALSREELRRRVVFDRWAQLEEARAGAGVLFVTMHFGNWDMGAAALADRGHRISVIADTFADPRLNELVLESRRRLGMQILPAERLGPRLLRILRGNGIVAALIDVPPPGAGVEVEFFGGTVAVHDGVARLALRSGASVVTGAVRRLGPWSDRVTGEFWRIRYEPTGDRERDVRALTQAIVGSFEGIVRAHPEQWYIFRPLWRDDIAAEAAGRA